ncbi:General transcription factor 3C polypeptide 3 [Pseudolycoriella hygida]|uniref:General transcription factor 3C polypeptide 3 n=1 Tax=Pseudolycoriella hygida TaxID=35572 RepID=A0A9Q0NHQ0_9DIPT|nr:General transcription factor 3C polypeptide 3 [Pseudolycoriella hygida]
MVSASKNESIVEPRNTIHCQGHQSTNANLNIQNAITTSPSNHIVYVQPDTQSNIKLNEGIEHLEDRINQINNDNSTSLVARRNHYNRSTSSVNDNIINGNETNTDVDNHNVDGKMSSICDNGLHFTNAESKRIQKELKHIGLNNYKRTNLSIECGCDNKDIKNPAFSSSSTDAYNQCVGISSTNSNNSSIYANANITTPSTSKVPDYLPMAPIKSSDKIPTEENLFAKMDVTNPFKVKYLLPDKGEDCNLCCGSKDRPSMCSKSTSDMKASKDKESKSKIANLSKKLNRSFNDHRSTQISPDRFLDVETYNSIDYPIEDCDEVARMQRAREIHEGVDPPPGHRSMYIDPTYDEDDISLYNRVSYSSIDEKEIFSSGRSVADGHSIPDIFPNIMLHVDQPQRIIHSQVDFIHCLVPDLRKITNCGFYWGKMDRYEAERLLEGKPEGTFLLRDSAQEEFLFSVSFRKYGRSLHARIEQFNHKFSFDCHDPGVFTSPEVTGLLEHYKDPACVMFFEPALTQPLNRNFCFTLQQKMEDEDDDFYMEVNADDVVIEEVATEDLQENEISQFRIITPNESTICDPNLTRSSVIASTSTYTDAETILPEQEEILIKKLINGEIGFADYNAQVGNIIDDVIIDEPEEIIEETGVVKTDSNDDFTNELYQSRREAFRGNLTGRSVNKEGKITRRRCMLPPALQGLMGEANLCYVRGQTDLAEKLCFEIIRQVPLSHEPFLTLAQIHENNPEKYMQFSLIAAHLNPSDMDQWIRIANLAIEQGNVKQAINCYAKASKFHPRDVSLRLERIKLLESIGEDKLAFRCTFSLLSVIPPEEGEFLLDRAKYVANKFVEENKLRKGLCAMNIAYAKISHMFKLEDIHMYLELLISSGSYKMVLDVLCAHAGVNIVINDEAVDTENYVTVCEIPDSIILDFRAKLIVSLVHLRAFHFFPYLFENITKFIDVEEAGDCWLDIAEALMKENRFHEALKLLIPLVKSKNYSLAAVWLRHADCFRAINQIDQAIESYQQVVKLAPQHFDARLTLSALLKKQGKYAAAMTVLEQDLENEIIDPCVLYERCFMLKETGNLDQYVDVSFFLLSRNSIKLRNAEEMTIAASIGKFSNKIAMIKEHRVNNSEPVDDTDMPEFIKSDNEPALENEWNLFKDIITICYERERLTLMRKIILTLLTSKRLVSAYSRELDFLAMLSSIYSRDNNLSYILAKEFLNKHMDLPRAWNLFNVVLQFSVDIRYSRYLLRVFRRVELLHITPAMIRANYFLLSGSYKYAINDYMCIFEKTQSPLLALLIAITYSHLGQQKFIEKRHAIIGHSLAYSLKYQELREDVAPHEVYYNLGRLHHHLGINHVAVHHYQKVLSYTSDLINENKEYLDLKREAAFNLHLIYKQSGNFHLARKYLHDYVVV